MADEGEPEASQASEEVQSIAIEEEEAVKETDDEIGENLAKKYSSHYFLEKHSPSFQCMEQYLCSQSELFATISFFPPLPYPDLDEVLNYIPPPDEIDETGVEKYIKSCRELEIVTISRVVRGLTSDILNLKYYGLTLKQMRGIADALKVNLHVKVCILQDNWMCPDSCLLIGDILRENNILRVLNLSECRIGIEGAEALAEGIASTQFLQELDLSFNSLGDEGLFKIKPSLLENQSIKKLNISHNELTEDSADTLAAVFKENKCLEDVDLSWNGFFTAPGNKKIFKTLLTNESIRRLNMAWNGIGSRPAMVPITKYIKKSQCLEHLDLNFNRINMGAFKALKGALNNNKSLTSVRVGNNLYTPDEAYQLAQILTNQSHQLRSIDMENMCVPKQFLDLLKTIKRLKKSVTYGFVLKNYTIKGPQVHQLLFNRCKFLAMKPKKKKAKKDFGHFVLSLPEKPATNDEFLTLLKKKKVKKLDKDLLKELTTQFATKGGKVDCAALTESYMKFFPDTVLPPPPEKKPKKGKKDKKKKKLEETVEAAPQLAEEPKLDVERKSKSKSVVQIVTPTP